MPSSVRSWVRTSISAYPSDPTSTQSALGPTKRPVILAPVAQPSVTAATRRVPNGPPPTGNCSPVTRWNVHSWTIRTGLNASATPSSCTRNGRPSDTILTTGSVPPTLASASRDEVVVVADAAVLVEQLAVGDERAELAGIR